MKSRLSYKSWEQWITKESPCQCSYGELQYAWRTMDINPPPRWCELLGWGTGILCCNWSLEALCSGGVTGVIRCCWALGAPSAGTKSRYPHPPFCMTCRREFIKNFGFFSKHFGAQIATGCQVLLAPPKKQHYLIMLYADWFLFEVE